MDIFGTLITQLNLLDAGKVNYIPYSFADDIRIMVGTPPVRIVGLDSIACGMLNPPSKLVMSLNNTGIFVNNLNQAGFIELTLLDGSFSSGAIQAIEYLGIPFPIAVVDTASGGTSRVLGTACRRVNTPTWRRSLRPGRVVFTFHTPRLLLFNGIRLAQSA